ncbi:UNVERIFIED_ORG: hypothetical protein OKW25_004183 [Pseudomonas vranovensis]|nr:hypothetical protein [Pseudomonas vranovensis]
MSTDGALSRTRWLPRLIGVLLLLMGPWPCWLAVSN